MSAMAAWRCHRAAGAACGGALSDLLYTRRGLLLLAAAGAAAAVVRRHLPGLAAGAAGQRFFGFDDFSGQVVRELTLDNFARSLEPANLDVALRTLAMARAVTLACSVLGFPVAYYMARYARGAQKALLYIAVMLPLWASYLVGLRLEAAAGQGRRHLLAAQQLHLSGCSMRCWPCRWSAAPR